MESEAAEPPLEKKIHEPRRTHIGTYEHNSTLLLYRSRADFLESCNQPLLPGTDNSPFWIVFAFVAKSAKKDGTFIFMRARASKACLLFGSNTGVFDFPNQFF